MDLSIDSPAAEEPSARVPPCVWSAALAALVVGAFGPTISELIGYWWDNPDYSHGFLMPVVAAYLLWERRASLAKLPFAPSLVGFVFLLLSLALLLMGEMKLSWFLKPYALVGALGGLVWTFYGWRAVRLCLPALVVLLLMCPLPGRVQDAITHPLKRVAALFATGLLDYSGVSTHLEGNKIVLPIEYDLFVHRACSGIRSLISLVSLAIIATFFWRVPRWLKLVVVLSAIPIAIIMNGLRIYGTAMLFLHVSPESGQGFYHYFEGFLLFGAGGVLLFLWAVFLGWAYRAMGGEQVPRRVPSASEPQTDPTATRSVPSLLGVLVLLALAVATWGVQRVRSYLADDDADPAIERQIREGLAKLPMELDGGEWRGQEARFENVAIEQSGADVHLSRFYRDRHGWRVQLYVGGQIRNQENFHAPTYCLPSLGWDDVDSKTVPFDLYPVDDAEPRMTHLQLQKGDDAKVVYFWFQAGRHVHHHEWQIRWLRFLDMLQGRDFSPTLQVAVYTDARGRSFQEAEEATKRFLEAIGPSLGEVIEGSLQ